LVRRFGASAGTAGWRGPIVTSSLLHARREDVWRRVCTTSGINDELWPLFRMTAPRVLRERGLERVKLGQRICRSWVLLLGVLPVDYDDITLVRLEPPAGFLERSRMLSQRTWEHERALAEAPGGCVLTDRITYVPRVPVPDRVLRALYGAVFRHRHRRLRRRFGGRALAASTS
jgi:ligand-binding SRPBCC domain-containing protein